MPGCVHACVATARGSCACIRLCVRAYVHCGTHSGGHSGEYSAERSGHSRAVPCQGVAHRPCWAGWGCGSLHKCILKRLANCPLVATSSRRSTVATVRSRASTSRDRRTCACDLACAGPVMKWRAPVFQLWQRQGEISRHYSPCRHESGMSPHVQSPCRDSATKWCQK